MTESALVPERPEVVADVLARHRDHLRAIEQANDFPENFLALLDHAVDRPGDTAIIDFFDQGVTLTAAEFRSEVLRFADGLQQKGVGQGTHVGVLLPNRIEFAITWMALGVLGAVMVPVNPASTGVELDHVFCDTAASHLILQHDFGDRARAATGWMADYAPTFIPVTSGIADNQAATTSGSWEALRAAGDPSFRPARNPSANDPVNIQYTSGSTGLPKGCLLPQRFWIVMGAGRAQSAKIPARSILCAHPFFYMDPQWHLVMALYSGAEFHQAETLSASKFVERVRAHEAEFSLFPRPLVGQSGSPDEAGTTLKIVSAVGAGRDAVRDIRSRFGCHANNAFGMTEIGVGLTVPEDLHDPDADGSCGIPALFREARIVADGVDVEPGEPGELWMRGDGLLLGYHNRPEANAESFVDGWFRTGDLARVDEKGYHWIVGRLKDMIRRSSQNISALEVEQVVTSTAGVQLAAAVAVPDDYRGEEVKVYVLLEDGEDPHSVPPDAIITTCEAALSAYKVPRFIEYVDDFPFTASSKIDKPALLRDVDDLRLGAWDREATT